MRMYTSPALGDPGGKLVRDILLLRKVEEVSTGVVVERPGTWKKGTRPLLYPHRSGNAVTGV